MDSSVAPSNAMPSERRRDPFAVYPLFVLKLVDAQLVDCRCTQASRLFCMEFAILDLCGIFMELTVLVYELIVLLKMLQNLNDQKSIIANGMEHMANVRSEGAYVTQCNMNLTII
uniref:Uncharacterized protein n=1 Tax=Trichuris muris TaxID=70415 RepID=A0A5S6QHU5_TRIMR